MAIEIHALDTLFFRDGRPFAKGMETWANGVFPPAPSVLYGALRSSCFSKEFTKGRPSDDPTGNLAIKGIFLKMEDNIYFPLPLDCVKEKDDKEHKVFPLSLKDNTLVSNCPTPMLLKADLEVENVNKGHLTDPLLEKYLNNKIEVFEYKDLDNYVINEPKIGIARNKKTHSSQEEMLYRVDMRRLDKVSIVVNYDGLTLPEQGFLKLGGEGKGAVYKTIKDIVISPPTLQGDIIKLCFATPTIFKQGWLPSWINKDSLEGEYQGIKLKLLTAVVGKHVPVGGFNMRRKKPKPMVKAVPAGSVYYFKIIKGKDCVIDTFHQKNINDYMSKRGFGLAFIGGRK